MQTTSSLKGYFSGKTVLVTGHTGFKGGWLTVYLGALGARVVGFSNAVPTAPALFDACGIAAHATDVRGDVRDPESVARVFRAHDPDVVFHLAAQPIVTESYRDPVGTVGTNVIGTANVLDQVRRSAKDVVAVMVTSDKAYENREWCWGYRENDALGGKDPYSASKAAAEIVAKAFYHSYLSGADRGRRMVTVRAGNVVGGGDWAPNRIIPDCVRAWSAGKPVVLRAPGATRPWQHVLEPLSGYLVSAATLALQPELSGESFNFGPRSAASYSVMDIVTLLAREWRSGAAEIRAEEQRGGPHEARLLRLVCEKAETVLGWTPQLSVEETARMTGEWYAKHHAGCGPEELYAFTRGQVDSYEARRDAAARGGAA
jgi:CDP-glucose 4,6-dehydratase